MDGGSMHRERSHGSIPADSVGELHPRASLVPRSSPVQPSKKQFVSQWSCIQRYGAASSRKHAEWPQNRVCVTFVASTFAARLHGHLSPWLTPDKRINVSVLSWQLRVRDSEGCGIIAIHGLCSNMSTHRRDLRQSVVMPPECG